MTRYGACRLHRCLTPLTPSPWTLAHIPWTLSHTPLPPLTPSHTLSPPLTPPLTHICTRMHAHLHPLLTHAPLLTPSDHCLSTRARAHKHANTRAGMRARASTTSPSAGAVTWSLSSSPPRRTRCCARGSRTRTTSLTWRRARSRTEGRVRLHLAGRGGREAAGTPNARALGQRQLSCPQRREHYH